MATTTRSRGKASSTRETNPTRKEDGERPLFNFQDGNTGVLLGAVAAGAAFGIAANFGRKFLVQATSASAGDWVDALTAEHAATLALFDKLELTDDSQTTQRTALLKKIKYALSKHSIQEEMVVYPALRQANFASDADHLGEEHGYIKTYIYELDNMAKDSPEWLPRARDFRNLLESHMNEEEKDIFPTFRERLSDEQNAKITTLMNKEGFKFA
jgi:hemerythrin-like domain-containing protein